jgi:hypothetical protein
MLARATPAELARIFRIPSRIPSEPWRPPALCVPPSLKRMPSASSASVARQLSNRERLGWLGRPEAADVLPDKFVERLR